MSGQLLTVAQLAQYLNIPKKTIYNFVSQGRIPYLKAGGALRFSLERIDIWLEAGARARRSSGEEVKLAEGLTRIVAENHSGGDV